MESCLIYEKDNDSIRILETACIGEFFEGNAREFIWNTWEKEEFTLSSIRMNKSVHILPFVPSLVMCERSFSYRRPYSSHNRLKPHSCFIFRPNLYFFLWIFEFRFPVEETEFFLKASCSSGVALFSWARRGVLREKPSAWSCLHPVTADNSFPVISPRYFATFGQVQSHPSGETPEMSASLSFSFSASQIIAGRWFLFLASVIPARPCLLYLLTISWAQVSFISTRFMAVLMDTASTEEFWFLFRSMERKWSLVLSVGFFASLYNLMSSSLVWWKDNSMVCDIKQKVNTIKLWLYSTQYA